MIKAQQIDGIIATRDNDLLLGILGCAPAIVEKIRSKLDKVSTKNMKYYHKHFCGEVAEVKA